MKVKYTGGYDAVLIGRTRIANGESTDIKDLGLTEEQGKALVDAGDFTSGTYKAKQDAELIPPDDFASEPPAPTDPPAASPEKE